MARSTPAKTTPAKRKQLHLFIQQHKRSAGNTLLDVGCGTGSHLPYLAEQYQVTGLDASADMLAIARQRHPNVSFHQVDMTAFALPQRFNVITCLFSAIGYVLSVERLFLAIQTMAQHLQPGGVLLVEPWLKPTDYRSGSVHSTFVDQPELRIARMCVSRLQERVSVMEMHYLVATPQGVNYFTDLHELMLFSHDEYLQAFASAHLQTTYDAAGLTGRGLYIGVK
ncbi:MAG: class I SAM-dependent methyltransferase [Caldilineaceae bacterium]